MSIYNCALKEYSLTKALTWGSFREHAYVETKKGSLGRRVIHLIVASAEFLPIIGQIVSLAEMILMCTFNIVQPLRFRSRAIDNYYTELMGTNLYEKGSISQSAQARANYTPEERTAFAALETAFERIQTYENGKRILKLEGEELSSAVTLYEEFANSLFAWDKIALSARRLDRQSVYDQLGTPLLSLFKLYQEGKAQPDNEERKEKVISHSCYSDERESLFLYTEILENKGNPKDLEKAKRLYLNFYKRDSAVNPLALEAGYRILTRYPEYVEGADTSIELTLQKLAELGHTQALSDYGVSLLTLVNDQLQINKITEENQKKAFELFLKAANFDVLDGQYNLTVCYRNGIGVEKNPQLALQWCRKAAEAGHTQAMTLMGIDSLEGEAIKWFEQAAEKGNPIAKLHLGYYYETGRGCDKNLENAEKLYTEVTKRKLPPGENDLSDIGKLKMTAHFRLGNLYLDSFREELGRSAFNDANDFWPYYSTKAVVTKKNLEKRKDMLDQMILDRENEAVVDWFHQNLLDWSLGFSSARGERSIQNFLVIRRWHKELAHQGIAAAQFQMALAYKRGESNEIPENKAEAKRYLELAAAQGHSQAAFELSEWRESL